MKLSDKKLTCILGFMDLRLFNNYGLYYDVRVTIYHIKETRAKFIKIILLYLFILYLFFLLSPSYFNSRDDARNMRSTL